MLTRSFARAPTRRFPLWRLKRRGSNVTCILKQAADNAFVVAVAMNGDEIAARRYHTKAAAIGDAGFLLERLAADGWTLVVGFPSTTLH
jgi:hypothetical protein